VAGVQSQVAVIRILHVIASIARSTGGPAKAVADMARAVAARGHDVAIYTTDRDMTPDERAAPSTDDGVARHVFPQGFPSLFATSWPLARALDDAIPRADILHVHSLYLFHVWYAARVCARAGVPYLLRPHGTLDPFLWRRHRARTGALRALRLIKFICRYFESRRFFTRTILYHVISTVFTQLNICICHLIFSIS
jgi:glycosyltransferase involved in cell wall biosynthesis